MTAPVSSQSAPSVSQQDPLNLVRYPRLVHTKMAMPYAQPISNYYSRSGNQYGFLPMHQVQIGYYERGGSLPYCPNISISTPPGYPDGGPPNDGPPEGGGNGSDRDSPGTGPPDGGDTAGGGPPDDNGNPSDGNDAFTDGDPLTMMVMAALIIEFDMDPPRPQGLQGMRGLLENDDKIILM